MRHLLAVVLILVATASFGELYLGNAPLLTHGTATFTGCGANQTTRYLLKPLLWKPILVDMTTFAAVSSGLANLSYLSKDASVKHILKDAATASMVDSSIRIGDDIMGELTKKKKKYNGATKVQWIYRGVVFTGLAIAVKKNIHDVKN
jgi:hypothetical protein